MSSDSSQDKQLPSTERRLRKAREEGQVARSRELAHFAVTAAALGVLVAAAPALVDRLHRLLAAALRFDHATATTPERMLERFGDMNDIIGGNSCSPIINKKGEAVGLVFDGNIESLPGNFIYDPVANRTVSVHAGGIIAALKYIYKADRIVKELGQ